MDEGRLSDFNMMAENINAYKTKLNYFRNIGVRTINTCVGFSLLTEGESDIMYNIMLSIAEKHLLEKEAKFKSA